MIPVSDNKTSGNEMIESKNNHFISLISYNQLSPQLGINALLFYKKTLHFQHYIY